MTDSEINIELIYPTPDKQRLINISVPLETTVLQAIDRSKILTKYPEIDLDKNKIGIFSKIVKLTEVLREGDRIEIYRPLIADPKEARKKKAAKKT